METYDFAVIGGGSAGYAGAATAGQLGLKTVCIEGGEDVGGLCILRGCMPSKTLIESANRFLSMRRAGEFGLKAGQIGFDAAAIVRRKRNLIAGFADYRVKQLMTGKYEFKRGWAEFIDPNRVKIHLGNGGEEELWARTFLISTGSILNLIDLPGLQESGYLHSDLALDTERVPRSVIILGGGAIALEFAHFYSSFRSKVTVLQRSEQLIKEADRDMVEPLMAAFQHREVDVQCGTKLLGISRTGDGKRVSYLKDNKEQAVEAEEIFYALGRRAAVDSLNLDSILKYDRSGIKVNDAMQTSQPHIFAAGDVTGLFDVVHIAIEQGIAAARNAAKWIRSEPLETIDYRLKLFCMFTEPQLAFVGLTEKEAARQALKVCAATYPFADHGKAIVRGETDGMVKLITLAKDGRIIGGAVVGPEASELIHEIVVAMYFHSTAATLAGIPHYHPTLSEIWTYPAEELA